MTVTDVRTEAVPGFGEFVAAEGAGLLCLAYLLTTDEEPAVAVLEGALARTYGHWPRLAASGRPEDFVRRVIVQEATEQHRLRRPTTVPSPRSEDRPDELVMALRALPADERAATVLRHCMDMSEMETAATLGCTVGAVRRQTMRALARLRDLAPPLASSRSASHGLVDLLRQLQSSLRALPERIEMSPAPELLRNVQRTHERRTMRRRAAIITVTAGLLLLLAVIVLQVTGGGDAAPPAVGPATEAAASIGTALRI